MKELTKEQIDNYISKLIDRRKTIQSLIEKNPITGIDVSKLETKQKLFLGGIRKLAIEIDEEILSILKFVYEFDKEIKLEADSLIKEIKEKQIQLFDFEGDNIKLNKNIDSILKDIK